MRKPDQIMADFDAAAQGTSDIGIYEILHEIIADIQHSYTLAGVTEAQTAEVNDYIANHY